MEDRLTKTTWVIDELRKAINDGSIRPGERVLIQDWAQRLQVSATPVREAVKMLAVEGAVVIVPHRGAVASSFSSTEYRDNYQIWRALDTLAIEMMFEKTTPEDRATTSNEMLEINQQMGEAVKRRELSLADDLNRRFHIRIYEMAGSAMLQRFRSQLYAGMPVANQSFWAQVSRGAENIAQVLKEHANIAEAIGKGNKAKALAAVLAHAESGAARLTHPENKGPR